MDSLLDFARSRRGVAAIIVIVALIATALGVFILGPDADEPVAAAPVAPPGMITIEDAPDLPAADVARPATERPATPVAQVALGEECAAAAAPLRTLISERDSGLNLDEAGMNSLNEGLTGLVGGCSQEEVEAFQAQELLPWMNYAIS